MQLREGKRRARDDFRVTGMRTIIEKPKRETNGGQNLYSNMGNLKHLRGYTEYL